MPGEYTIQEIMSQPDAWTQALEYLQQQTPALTTINPQQYDDIIVTGCGSTYYLAQAAAILFQTLSGTSAKGLPASEIWLNPDTTYHPSRKTLLIAVSRSGTTTETLRAVTSFKENAHGQVITLCCYPESDLASMGDINLILTAGQEKSVAQTRAFTVLYLATVFLAHHWANKSTNELNKLPDACTRLLESYEGLAERLGRNAQFDRFYFLGSGARYGLACELSLKMKEMTLSHSEPFHFLEFRHGPQSMVSDSTLIIGLVSEANGDKERLVLHEMKERGAQVLSLAEHDADVVLNSGVHEELRNALFLPVVQRLAFERALFKNLNPDKPHNLEAVVILS